MRLRTKRLDQAPIVQTQRLAPQVPHLQRLAKQRDERRGGDDQRPREAPDWQASIAHCTTDRRDHRRAIRIPMASEVENLERAERIKQADRVQKVRQQRTDAANTRWNREHKTINGINATASGSQCGLARF